MVREPVKRARLQGFPKVIALTCSADFSCRLGFSVQPKDKFPRKPWRKCLHCLRLEDCDDIAMSRPFVE
jgi:amino-acid N-acetyltransferase